MVTYLGSLVQLCCRIGGILQTIFTGMCGECSQCMDHTGFASAQSLVALASLVAQLVKNLPALQETWVQSLGWENPLGKARLPTPVFLPGEFHGLSRPWGSQRV